MTERSEIEFVEVRVTSVVARPGSADNPLFAVTLEELDGDRRFCVVVRKPEADAIAASLEHLQFKRPLTYDLMALGRLPVFRGTRVPARALLDYLAVGDSLDAFPSICREQALARMESRP